MLDGGRTPIKSFQELENMGYSRCSVPVMTTYAAAMGIQKALAKMMSDGTNQNLGDMIIPFSEFNKIIGLPKIREIEEQFLTEESISTRYGSVDELRMEREKGH